MQKRYFLLRMLVPRSAPVFFIVSHWRAEKDWFVAYLLFLPHVPARSVTSPLQTAGHKIAILVVVFSRLPNVETLKPAGREIQWITSVCVFLFRRYRHGPWCFFGSVPFPGLKRTIDNCAVSAEGTSSVCPARLHRCRGCGWGSGLVSGERERNTQERETDRETSWGGTRLTKHSM